MTNPYMNKTLTDYLNEDAIEWFNNCNNNTLNQMNADPNFQSITNKDDAVKGAKIALAIIEANMTYPLRDLLESLKNKESALNEHKNKRKELANAIKYLTEFEC